MKHFFNFLIKSVIPIVAVMVLMGFQQICAQQTISGNIMSEDTNESLPGVNVSIKGTVQGTITDIAGNYQIDVPGSESTLIFSSVGYVTQEIVVGNRSVINLVLAPDVKALEEIVVIGYGTVKKSDLTGSVSSISAKQMEEIPIQSLEQAMQGRAAGVQVTQASHAPGGGISVRVRGSNSINSASEPLYVIDGYPIYSNNNSIPNNAPNDGVIPQMNLLSGLNPGDIERIEILKDASATAIYGARGANGVVLITTKRGKEGKAQVDYSTYYGLQEMANKIDMMNAYQFAAIHNEMSVNSGQVPRFTGQIFDGQYHGTPEEYQQGYYTDDDGNRVNLPDTDWQEEILRTGTIMNHQLSLSGGNQATKYALSANYFQNEGVIKGGDFTRYSFRTNLDTKATNWLDIGASVSYNYSVSNNSGSEHGLQWFNAGTVSAALKAWPVFSPYTEEGSFNVAGTGTLRGNPVAYAEEAKNELLNDRILANMFAKFQLIEGLDLRISLGTDMNTIRRNRYMPTSTYEGSLQGGTASKNYNFIRSWLNENVLSYNKEFGDNHRINAVAGFTLQQEVAEGSSAGASEFPNDVFEDNNMSAGANQTGSAYSFKNKWSLASWLGRVNYSLKDRYLLTLTGRADGSSKFGADNKWAFFPSAAIAWRLSEEDFMQNQKIFSDLKLRGSYGKTGNAEIGLYRSLAMLSIQSYTFAEGIKNTGVGPIRMGNPDLQWETTNQFDIGAEFAFMENRLRFITDFYVKKTEDLLLAVNLPGTAGFTPPSFAASEHLRNVGKLENRGMEYAMSFNALVGEFKWNINANISFNRNEVTELTEGGAITMSGNGLDKHGGQVYIDVGLPLGVWRYPVIDGIFHTQEEIEEANAIDGDPNTEYQVGATPGDVRYKDVAGAFDEQGNPMPDGQFTGDDVDIIGDPNPDYIFGITNTFSWKGFDLIVFINGSQGNDIVAPHFAHAHQMGSISNGNLTAAMWDRWTPDNPDSDIPKAGANYDWGNNQVFDGSFVRIKNVRLNYNIPAVNIDWLRSAQVYVNVQNLATFTDYIGYDPEVNSAGQSSWQNGIDQNGFPAVRTVMVGVQFGL